MRCQHLDRLSHKIAGARSKTFIYHCKLHGLCSPGGRYAQQAVKSCITCPDRTTPAPDPAVLDHVRKQLRGCRGCGEEGIEP